MKTNYTIIECIKVEAEMFQLQSSSSGSVWAKLTDQNQEVYFCKIYDDPYDEVVLMDFDRTPDWMSSNFKDKLSHWYRDSVAMLWHENMLDY